MTVPLREVRRNTKRQSKALGTSSGRLVAVANNNDTEDDSDRSVNGTLRSTLNEDRSNKGKIGAKNVKKNKIVSSRAAQISSDSDSDDYSSDTVVVASSIQPTTQSTANARRTTSSQKEHIKPRLTRPATVDVAAHKVKADKGKGRAVDAAEVSIDRLPTPESLRDSSGDGDDMSDKGVATQRRLVKSDKKTPVKEPAKEASSITASSSRKSFAERLQSNATPQYSKGFKKHVKSGASTSIPLNDERFASDESEDDEEESDAPKFRQHKRPISKVSPKAALGSSHKKKKQGIHSKAIQIEDSSDASYEPVQVGNNTSKPRDSSSELDSDEELPDLPGTGKNAGVLTSSTGKKSEYRETLGELSKRRQLSDKKHRFREKHSKRVVSTPSPSPPPVRVLARNDPSPAHVTSSSGSGKITTRAIDPAGKPPKKTKKIPLFRVSDDDEDSDMSEPTGVTQTSRVVTASKGKGKGKEREKGKRNKRKKEISSSSSSSSSSELPTDVDSDESEIVEDIGLDFDPVVQDKLRPKDNSKAHRLDKLKQARAAKELREYKRKRGIIDSDEEVVDMTKDPRAVEEDSDDDTSSSEEAKNFIVEDDGDVDEEELEEAQRLMPTEFSAHGRLELKDHFHFFITSIVYRYFLPKSRHYREKKEFIYSKLQLDNAINGLINGSITSSIWLDEFRKALESCPDMIMEPIAFAPGCDGCNKYDRTASQRATLYGKPYDRETLLEDSEAEDEEMQFDLGRFCAEKADFHHSLRHTLKKTADIIRQECKKRSSLPKKLMGDSEERKMKREDEAARVVKILARGQFPIQTQLWQELDQLMDRAKHKFLK